MKAYLHIAIYWVVLLGTSCSVSNESVSGVYHWKDKKNSEFTEWVHLYSNYTFNLRVSNSFAPYPILHGSWHFNGKHIVLNSSNKVSMSSGEDTLSWMNVSYKVRCSAIIRKTRNNRNIKLKKFQKHFNIFKLDGETF